MEQNNASPEGLLKAISQFTAGVTLGDVKAFQWVYLFTDLADAQHVVQVLNAVGLIARAYANPDDGGAKVYFQFNGKTPLSEKLALAPSYLLLLRDVTDAMNRHTTQLNCRPTLHVSSPDGFNVIFSIKIEPLMAYEPEENRQAKPAQAAGISAKTSAGTSASVFAGAVNATMGEQQSDQKESRQQEQKPAKQIFQKKDPAKAAESNKMSALGDALGSSMVTRTSGLIKAFGIGFVIIIVFVMSRGFLCPDFAKAQVGPRPWYCS